MKRRIAGVPRKMKGELRARKTPICWKYAFWGFITSTVSILAIFGVTHLAGFPLLIGSFGASAVLLFGAIESPLAQPRNLVGGHLVSAAVAVSVVALGGSGPYAIALAVGGAIFLMYLTRTIHPPGGATALIGVQSHAAPSFMVAPVLAGAVILLLVALFTNNVVHHRQYPKHWF